MTLESANQRAKYLTELTKISHVVTKTNKEYFVVQKEKWNGTVVNTYNYEDIKQPEKENKPGEIPSVPDMLDTTGKKVLSGNRNKGTKASIKNG